MNDKGLYPNGTCYTPECEEASRRIPIADPQLIPGNPTARYRCVSCCDALAALVFVTLPAEFFRLPVNAPERAGFTAEAARMFGLTRTALTAEVAAGR